MSTYLAAEIRSAIDLNTSAQTLRLLELAVMVERLELALDDIVAEAVEDEQSLGALIRRCNA